MIHGLTGFRLDAKCLLRLFVLSIAFSLTGCISLTSYVDNGTKEVMASDFKKPAEAKPVQMLFEFQTKGVVNARVTDLMRERVTKQVGESGLFSTVGDKPVPNGALLSVTINNVPLTDNAYGKGFVTGLTLGAAGSEVTDGYVCTVKYLDAGTSQPIVKEVHHAIHSTIGAAAAPANSTKAESPAVAATIMTRQIVSQGLNELSRDPAFK
jgi:hypothetical protein